MAFAVGQKFFAGVKIPLPPGGDYLNTGAQSVRAEFEADLIIAFAGCTMGNRISPRLPRNFHQALRNQRTRYRGTKQVLTLVNCVGSEHRKDIFRHKLFPKVFYINLFDTHRHRLGSGRLDFFALTDVSGKRHDFAVIGGLKPFCND